MCTGTFCLGHHVQGPQHHTALGGAALQGSQQHVGRQAVAAAAALLRQWPPARPGRGLLADVAAPSMHDGAGGLRGETLAAAATIEAPTSSDVTPNPVTFHAIYHTRDRGAATGTGNASSARQPIPPRDAVAEQGLHQSVQGAVAGSGAPTGTAPAAPPPLATLLPLGTSDLQSPSPSAEEEQHQLWCILEERRSEVCSRTAFTLTAARPLPLQMRRQPHVQGRPQTVQGQSTVKIEQGPSVGSRLGHDAPAMTAREQGAAEEDGVHQPQRRRRLWQWEQQQQQQQVQGSAAVNGLPFGIGKRASGPSVPAARNPWQVHGRASAPSIAPPSHLQDTWWLRHPQLPSTKGQRPPAPMLPVLLPRKTRRQRRRLPLDRVPGRAPPPTVSATSGVDVLAQLLAASSTFKGTDADVELCPGSDPKGIATAGHPAATSVGRVDCATGPGHANSKYLPSMPLPLGELVRESRPASDHMELRGPCQRLELQREPQHQLQGLCGRYPSPLALNRPIMLVMGLGLLLHGGGDGRAPCSHSKEGRACQVAGSAAGQGRRQQRGSSACHGTHCCEDEASAGTCARPVGAVGIDFCDFWATSVALHPSMMVCTSDRCAFGRSTARVDCFCAGVYMGVGLEV
jgi:hypothetical protein